jgi:hypothetical protein
MSLKEVCLKAADLIETGGLNKGWYCGNDGSHCIMGAIIEQTRDTDYRVGDILSAIRWGAGLGASPDTNFMDVVHWNDAPERTKEDVAAALRKAAGYL